MQNSKNSGKKSYLICQCVGIVIAIAISIVMTLISALLISKEQLPLESQGILAVMIQFLSVLAGALWVGKSSKYNKMICCGILAATYCFILIGSAILFLEGVSDRIYTGLLACVAGCAIGVLLNTIRKPTKNRINRKRRVS